MKPVTSRTGADKRRKRRDALLLAAATMREDFGNPEVAALLDDCAEELHNSVLEYHRKDRS
jgi:hypothetical protein